MKATSLGAISRTVVSEDIDKRSNLPEASILAAYHGYSYGSPSYD